jgi:hypothetical protein
MNYSGLSRVLRAHPLKLRDGARRLEHVRYDLFINGIELNLPRRRSSSPAYAKSLGAVICLRIAEWLTRFELCPGSFVDALDDLEV